MQGSAKWPRRNILWPGLALFFFLTTTVSLLAYIRASRRLATLASVVDSQSGNNALVSGSERAGSTSNLTSLNDPSLEASHAWDLPTIVGQAHVDSEDRTPDGRCKHPHGKVDILIVADQKAQEKYRANTQSVSCYAKLHDYGFRVINPSVDYPECENVGRNFFFRRMCAIKKHLQQTSAQWVMPLDGDVAVVNFNKVRAYRVLVMCLLTGNLMTGFRALGKDLGPTSMIVYLIVIASNGP